MSFTYDAAAETWTDLAKVRLTIGDVTENAGPLPGKRNYSDQELTALIANGGNWQRGAVLALRNAAAAWASQDRSISMDGYSESIQRSKLLSDQADKLETALGSAAWAGGLNVGGLGVSTVKKITDISE